MGKGWDVVNGMGTSAPPRINTYLNRSVAPALWQLEVKSTTDTPVPYLGAVHWDKGC